jgi:membrane-bound lytic murein transglycosylase D
VAATGTTDIGTIIATYRGPLFGFAGRNFYPELLAAREASAALLADTSGLAPDTPQEFEEFALPAFVKISVLSRVLGVSRRALVELNPALTRHALEELRYLPKGFRVKLPPGRGGSAEALFATLPPADRPLTEPPRTYRVRRGDTLGELARRFQTTTRALQRLNGIRNPNRLRAGVLLKLPH